MNLSAAPTSAPAANAEPTQAIDVCDICYSYGDERVALDALSLQVLAGAIFGLLGPNGSGKSTLLSILIGRRTAASGTVMLLGQSLAPRLRGRMAIVFQEPSLDPNMTVRETMAMQGRMFGLKPRDAARETSTLLERLALADRASEMTATLSGGLKRRLELARALLTHPEVILLDEPTLALDPDSRHGLWQHLLAANRDGCTLLLATNDVHEAERYCQTVALLDRGRVVAQGAPGDLKRDLRRDAVRIEWKTDATPEVLTMQSWPGVGHVRLADRTTHVTVDAASPFLTRLFQASGDRVHSVQIEESTLEDVYFQLVGAGIRPPSDGIPRETAR